MAADDAVKSGVDDTVFLGGVGQARVVAGVVVAVVQIVVLRAVGDSFGCIPLSRLFARALAMPSRVIAVIPETVGSLRGRMIQLLPFRCPGGSSAVVAKQSSAPDQQCCREPGSAKDRYAGSEAVEDCVAGLPGRVDRGAVSADPHRNLLAAFGGVRHGSDEGVVLPVLVPPDCGLESPLGFQVDRIVGDRHGGQNLRRVVRQDPGSHTAVGRGPHGSGDRHRNDAGKQ